jgi:hypothetical protein
LHLLIDEFLKRFANYNGALEGQPEIVDHQRYGSSHLIEAQPSRLTERQRHFGPSSGPWRRKRILLCRNVSKVGYGLAASVFKDFEVRGLEIGYLLALSIGHYGIHLNKCYRDPNDLIFFRDWLFFGASRLLALSARRGILAKGEDCGSYKDNAKDRLISPHIKTSFCMKPALQP